MSNSQDDVNVLRRALERERMARKEAERILEEKSMELYNANLKLEGLNVDLEEDIQSTKLELHKTETRFNDLVYTASDIIFKVDLTGHFKYVNKVAVELSGFAKEMFLKNNFRFIVREDFKEKLIEHFQHQLQTKLKSTYIEFPAISSDGHEIWLGQSTNLIFEGETPIEFFGLARNISDRKEAENLTNYTKTKLEAIIENLNSGILVEDKERNITKVNQTFCDLFGIPVSPDQLLGTNCSSSAEDIKHLMEHPVEFVNRINEIVEKREVSLSEELKMRDGNYLERDYVPLYLEGQFIGQLWNIISF
jgi:PAS domain S-box-containing protein